MSWLSSGALSSMPCQKVASCSQGVYMAYLAAEVNQNLETVAGEEKKLNRVSSGAEMAPRLLRNVSASLAGKSTSSCLAWIISRRKQLVPREKSILLQGLDTSLGTIRAVIHIRTSNRTSCFLTALQYDSVPILPAIWALGNRQPSTPPRAGPTFIYIIPTDEKIVP